MQYNSRPVVSNQLGPHHDVRRRVNRALTHPLRKPISDHTLSAFQQADRWFRQHHKPLILDSGCGVGVSTRRLANQFPKHAVIGIDRSAARLGKDHGALPDNALLVQADLVDFWRLAEQSGWALERHYVLYPNPYPKSGHLKMRWHGHPVLPTLLALGGRLEVRTNWQLYIEEFAYALSLVTGKQAEVATFTPGDDYLAPFEAKYAKSGHVLWRLRAVLERVWR